eukprot:750701-Hanusia_phi.AAC.7
MIKKRTNRDESEGISLVDNVDEAGGDYSTIQTLPSLENRDEDTSRTWLQEEVSNDQGQAEAQLAEDDVSSSRLKYEWSWLFMPRIPCVSSSNIPPPFFPLNQRIPWMMALVMGLQHAIAMVGGIVTPALLLAGSNELRLSKEETRYLVSAGLIVSGIASLIQVHQLKLGRTGFVLGTGLISVAGTSFTFLPIARSTAAYMMQEDSWRACAQDSDCLLAWASEEGVSTPGLTNVGQRQDDASTAGKKLMEPFWVSRSVEARRLTVPPQAPAWCAPCWKCSSAFFLRSSCASCSPSMLPVALPSPAALAQLVSQGVCVLLIGVGLTGTGIKYWGGGAFCAEHFGKRKVKERGGSGR